MTGKKRLLILAFPFLLLPGVCMAVESEMCSFRNDPLCFHENMRRRAMEGMDNRGVLEDLHAEFQEHSFDGLIHSPPEGNAGFILLYTAWVRWSESCQNEALQHYTKARRIFLDAGMESEARFCLYYMARIAAEQEKFPESIDLLNQALTEGTKVNAPYLEGLINESLGYALWYMDRLPESAESFGRSAELWLRIGYGPGMVNCWSNLGLLFQELDLPDQAWRAYENAINNLQGDTFPEIKFHLYRNCALFHYRNNHQVLASYYLLNCGEFRECDETLYILARAEILEQPELLASLNPEAPSMVFIRDLLRARFQKKEGNIDEAIALIRKVIMESQQLNMPRHTREARLSLAEIMVEQGTTDEARYLFQQALYESPYLDSIDILLPFSNSSERQLNGLIRCLIRSGKINEARAAIQEAVSLKTRKGKLFLQSLKTQSKADSDRLLSKAVIKMEEKTDSSPGLASESVCPPAGVTMVEFWPDGKELFVWVDNPRSHYFLQLKLKDWIGDIIRRLTSSLYSQDPFLPPEPSREISINLYRQLFQPLEPYIAKKRLLLIAHKELQALPFEMLQPRAGNYLLETYTFSYLPGRHYHNRTEDIPRPPLLIQPSNFNTRAGAARELEFLQSIYPGLEILESLDIKTPLTASLIHITSHLNLDRRYWLNSALTSENSSKNLADLLKQEMRCNLLSLGVCESANSVTSASPYWMGFSEMFMLNGANTLLTSRWRMDELSSHIYTEFFRLCQDGLPMDEALRKSKLMFLAPEQAGLPPQVAHPFYWAGITYVGEPGRMLSSPGKHKKSTAIAPLIFWLTLLVAGLLKEEWTSVAKRIFSSLKHRPQGKIF